jgi:dephospho-CoA kinase
MAHHRILVSGPIGSGKSLLLERLKFHNYEILKADDVSHEILKKDLSIQEKIIERWGESMYLAGKPNNVNIADIVFNHRKELIWLEQLIHPKVYRVIDEWVIRHDLCAVEIPIINSARITWSHETWVVLADSASRVQRVTLRDDLSLDQIKKRMNSQPQGKDYRVLADRVLMNNSTLDDFYKAIELCFNE